MISAMGSVWQDLKYACRTLRRTPGFAVVAVLSLALGIGANTAIFTLTNAVFLNPLPVQDSGRVIECFTVDHATTVTGANLTRTAMSWPNFKDFRDQNNSFTGYAGFIPFGATLTGHGEPTPENVMLTTANYFDVLGVKPALGRTFASDEDQHDGGNPVTVLSQGMWTRVFGGDRAALGKTIELNAVPYTVIGVMPAGFKGTLTIASADLAWIPISMHSQLLPGQFESLFNNRRFRIVSAFGRLKPGVTEGQALANMVALAANLERAYPDANKGRTIEVSSLAEAALGFLPRDVMVTAGIALSAVVGLVLLIACANLANLQLARVTRRIRELGIRTALGAERGRLARQLLTESLMISLAGGVLGLLFGTFGASTLWAFRPAFLVQSSLDLKTDWRVFLFTAGVTIVTGLLFGTLPAFRISIGNLSEILKSGGRGGSECNARSRLRGVLVTGEVALSIIALAAAGLLIRSMDQVQKINPGFETHNLLCSTLTQGRCISRPSAAASSCAR
jgi:predicted permease